MKLTYLYNSGFVIEGERFMMVLDYFKDAEEGFVRQKITSFQGRTYVLSTHWHPDHFTPEIMQWRKIQPNIRYILSKDILKRRWWTNFRNVTSLFKGQAYEDDTVRVQAFGSTDVGSSFLIEAEGKRIFHAGDLNFWHWSEVSTPEEIEVCERHFLKEVALLAETTIQLDLAMFPVDPRQGKDYMLGAEMFVDRIHTDIFVPMHFGADYEKIEAFRDYALTAGCRFIGWKVQGETIDF